MTPNAIENFDLRFYVRKKDLFVNGLTKVQKFTLDGDLADILSYPREVVVKTPFERQPGDKILELLKRRAHPNIVKVIDTYNRCYHYKDGKLKAIIFEYCNGGDLEKKRDLSKEEFFKWTFEIADALQFLHENNIVHGDVKPLNVFLHNKVAKLGDIDDLFSAKRQQKQTPQYSASDRANPPSKACDVYSFAKTVKYLWDKIEKVADENAINKGLEMDRFLADYLRPAAQRSSIDQFIQSKNELARLIGLY